MKLVLIPNGWPCALAKCPPGPFVFTSSDGSRHLGFKSEYFSPGTQGKPFIDAYNEIGEFFHPPDGIDRDFCIVRPVRPEWEEDDE